MSEILYDDPDFVVIEKEPYANSETLRFQDVFGEGSVGMLYCVHRLDMGVGGVCLYAKNQKTAATFSRMIQSGDIQKSYTALAEGIVIPEDGVLQDYLFHEQRSNKTFVVKKPRNGVKEAVLRYHRIEMSQKDGIPCSMIAVFPETGRTHQIRVQFASRKHPLAGDRKYGSKLKFEGIGLWCSGLTFSHPVTQETISCFSSPQWEAFCNK